MPSREHEPPVKLSIASTITLVLLIVAVATAWARMEARMTAVEHAIGRSNETLERIADTVQDLSRWRDTQTGSSTTTPKARR